MLSIIIPTKQEEKYIADAIEQFKTLSMSREIIVSDGRSTDTTADVARAHAARVVVFTGEHHNPAIGRNDGARAATGDILLFIDTDTRLKEPDHFIKTALKRFEEDPDLVGIACAQRVYPSEEKISDRIIFGIDNLVQALYNNILKSGWACGKCMIIRKSAFDRARGFPEHLVFGEDHHFFQVLAKIGKTRYFGDLVYYHSARRLHKLGIVHFLWLWFINEVYVQLFNTAKSKEWTPVR